MIWSGFSLKGRPPPARPALAARWSEQWVVALFSLPLALPWTRFGKAIRSRERLLATIEDLIKQRQDQM
jgi:cytochrome P450